MFTIRKALAVLLVAGTGFIATPSPATAAYVPGENVDLKIVMKSCVIGGTTLHIRATATSGGKSVAGTIRVKALGKTFTENDSDIKVSTKTPVVTQSTKYKVTADFEPTDKATAAASFDEHATTAFYSTQTSATIRAAFSQPPTVTRTVTLVPRSVGCSPGIDDASLPDTGGISILYVILGVLLLALGTAVLLLAARKRSNLSS